MRIENHDLLDEEDWTVLECGCKFNAMSIEVADKENNKNMSIKMEPNALCDIHINDSDALQEEVDKIMKLGITLMGFDADITDGDCPMCLNWIPNNKQRGIHDGAISRYDNETEICSACGTMEAMVGIQIDNGDGDHIWEKANTIEEWIILLNAIREIDEVRI